MVIVELSGGLGNQFFQYAVARNAAHRLNTTLKLTGAKKSFKPKHHGYYRLGDFNIQEDFATPEEVARVKATGIYAPPFPNFETCKQDIFISGHAFHSEGAFIGVEDIIRRELTLKTPRHEISAAWEKKILATENSVTLHIRHGDYLNAIHIHIIGAIPLNYYRACVAELKKSFENLTVFVFSDDLNWAQENLKLDAPTEFVKDCETDNEEFHLMTLCKHTIIANSTFSWWAAWLNPNPDKKVFAPFPWSRSGLWDNGIPSSWTRVRVDYEDTPVEAPPLLSIILHVGDNPAALNLCILSILNQNCRDFELIIFDDAAPADCKNLCRQAAQDRRVALFSSGKNIGKAQAWNRGLEYARGEYVLFLSAEDFLFGNAVRELLKIFSSRRSDIICGVHYLQEDPEGDTTVANLEGKKFFEYVDEQFKNLQTPYLFHSDDLTQKLMMTGARAFNPLLGTKFFKREFLNKNSLRFNENLAKDFELHFVANAAMISKEIMFIPEVFYCTAQA